MNADRRHLGAVCVALLQEGHDNEVIGDKSFEVLVGTVKHMLTAEHWQLKAQEKHEGKNASTDKQLAICRVAVPALEKAVAALGEDDFATAIKCIFKAIETDGT